MSRIMKIDIDKRFDIARRIIHDLIRIYNSIAPKLGLPRIVHYNVTPSQSFHAHVIVWLEDDVDCIGRYIIARLLGDDPARSILNLVRCANGVDRDILFAAKIARRSGG